MKSCVFSLFTFQTASQFPKRDNHSAEHVWFFVFYFRSFVITMNHQHILTASSRKLYHGSWVIWVMGQVFSGSHGSWVTRSDPSPTLSYIIDYIIMFEKQTIQDLAIPNRSRTSCALNTLRASIGLNITPWPWNVGYGSLKVTGNGTIG